MVFPAFGILTKKNLGITKDVPLNRTHGGGKNISMHLIAGSLRHRHSNQCWVIFIAEDCSMISVAIVTQYLFFWLLEFRNGRLMRFSCIWFSLLICITLKRPSGFMCWIYGQLSWWFLMLMQYHLILWMIGSIWMQYHLELFACFKW